MLLSFTEKSYKRGKCMFKTVIKSFVKLMEVFNITKKNTPPLNLKPFTTLTWCIYCLHLTAIPHLDGLIFPDL